MSENYDPKSSLVLQLQRFIEAAPWWTPPNFGSRAEIPRGDPPPAITQRCVDFVAALNEEERQQLAALLSKMSAAPHIDPPNPPISRGPGFRDPRP